MQKYGSISVFKQNEINNKIKFYTFLRLLEKKTKGLLFRIQQLQGTLQPYARENKKLGKMPIEKDLAQLGQQDNFISVLSKRNRWLDAQ